MTGVGAALWALGSGGLGGLVNALMTDNGFVMPRPARTPEGMLIWRPGMIGNIVIGAVAALVSWGLYGAAAGVEVMSPAAVTFTWAALAGALLVGVAGARWLTAEVDKTLLRAAASAAAAQPGNAALAAHMGNMPPAGALEAASAAHAEAMAARAP